MNLTETLVALAITATVAGASVKSIGFIDDARALSLSNAVANLELTQQHRDAFYGKRERNLRKLDDYIQAPNKTELKMDGDVACGRSTVKDAITYKAADLNPTLVTATLGNKLYVCSIE